MYIINNRKYEFQKFVIEYRFVSLFYIKKKFLLTIQSHLIYLHTNTYFVHLIKLYLYLCFCVSQITFHLYQ